MRPKMSSAKEWTFCPGEMSHKGGSIDIEDLNLAIAVPGDVLASTIARHHHSGKKIGKIFTGRKYKLLLSFIVI